MGNYSHQVKSKMIGIIKEMEATPWLYARNPEKISCVIENYHFKQ